MLDIGHNLLLISGWVTFFCKFQNFAESRLFNYEPNGAFVFRKINRMVGSANCSALFYLFIIYLRLFRKCLYRSGNFEKSQGNAKYLNSAVMFRLNYCQIVLPWILEAQISKWSEKKVSNNEFAKKPFCWFFSNKSMALDVRIKQPKLHNKLKNSKMLSLI